MTSNGDGADPPVVEDDATPLLLRSGAAAAVTIPRPPNDHEPQNKFVSLDFDRIVNEYSIAATRARSKQGREKKRKKKESSEEIGTNGNSGGPHKKVAAASERKDAASYSGISVARWALTALVGLCTGITAVVIVHCVDLLVQFRVTRLNGQMQYVYGSIDEDEMRRWYGAGYQHLQDLHFFDSLAQFGPWGVYIFYTGYNILLVLLSTALCVILAPMAVGSGIPEVKAYLNGVRVGEFAGLRLYFVKLLGTVLGVSSGLVVGPEGPVVHLGAILGASLTKTAGLERNVYRLNHACPAVGGCLGCASRGEYDLVVGEEAQEHKRHHTENEPAANAQRKKWWQKNSLVSSLFFYLSHFRNDLERRHLISIGAAAGFASAFGAPVGGLLYSMEEASSFFSHDMLWRTLTATAVATFCIAVYYGNLTRYSMLSLEIGGAAESLLTQFSEVPLYLIMGVLGGLLGAVFNNTNAFLNRARKALYDKVSNRRQMYVGLKLLESALLSAVTSVLMVTLALQIGICRGAEASDEEFRFIHRYNCAPGEINELGSLLFGSREESIRDILTDPEDFAPETLLSVGLLFLALMMITFGVALPTGIFMPTVLTGSSLGGFAGLLIKQRYIPSVHPSDFALIGAAAFLAGMQRNTVSLCVILMEGTGQTKALIPVIITVVCARTVGDLLSEGIYEELMELRGYPFLMHEPKPSYDMYTAGDVMNNSVCTINMVAQAESIETLLLTSDYSAFPVVEEKSGPYRGMVRRDQLIAALECKIYVETMAAGNERCGVVREDKDSRTGMNAAAEHDPERGWIGKLRTDYTLMHRGQCEDIYRSADFGRHRKHSREQQWADWSDEEATSWLRGNVLTSEDDSAIVFGMDETLPSGIVSNGGGSTAIVKKIHGKIVVMVPHSEHKNHIDVGAIMNKCAFSVAENCPLSRTFDLFTSMGLRHLPVLGMDSKVVGMITRYDLMDEQVHEKTKDV